MTHAEGCPYIGRRDSEAVHDGPCTQVAGYVVPKRLAQAVEAQARVVPLEEIDVECRVVLRPCCLTLPEEQHAPTCAETQARLAQEAEDADLPPVAGGAPQSVPANDWTPPTVVGEPVLHDQPRFTREALMALEDEPADEVDMVNHPPHYKRGGIEVIDVIEAYELGYHLGNVTKYVLRSDAKGATLQDLKKARWYLDRFIEKMEGEA